MTGVYTEITDHDHEIASIQQAKFLPLRMATLPAGGGLTVWADWAATYCAGYKKLVVATS